jgi:Acyclic terpene utilisation family protein AtuA
VRIGCAAGFWGDTETAAPQLLSRGKLDYLVFDYLAEITMSIMAGARLREPTSGYATDFVTRVMSVCMRPALEQRVRIVTNAGGLNPLACRDALMALAGTLGVAPKIAVVLGDDLLPKHAELSQRGVREMFDGRELPPFLLSANAYFGARPIVAALAAGADIVLTGRVVDSALVLGPLVHEFGWGFEQWDELAQGSLAGHIVECGAQATGGLFTDWERVQAGYDDMGYPIVECSRDGSFVVEKPAGTGGLVTPQVVYEQLVYEIGDPAEYVLPDVVCDFRHVHAEQIGDDRVRVSGARGKPPTPTYKVSATYPDGFRVDAGLFLAGEDAARKGARVAKALIDKIERLLVAQGKGPFRATRIDVLGAESTYGPHARTQHTREVVVRLSASHTDRDALKLMLRELPQAGTSMAPGFATLVGGRPQPGTVVRLFSCLVDKADVPGVLDFEGTQSPVATPTTHTERLTPSLAAEPTYPPLPSDHTVPLIALAYGRSGDKGNHSNIGILAREPRFLPWISAALTPEAVAKYLAHLIDPVHGRVQRFFMPGPCGFNFLLENALGGGGIASLRPDPQGKAHAQQLLAFPVPVPREFYEAWALGSGS